MNINLLTLQSIYIKLQLPSYNQLKNYFPSNANAIEKFFLITNIIVPYKRPILYEKMFNYLSSWVQLYCSCAQASFNQIEQKWLTLFLTTKAQPHALKQLVNTYNKMPQLQTDNSFLLYIKRGIQLDVCTALLYIPNSNPMLLQSLLKQIQTYPKLILQVPNQGGI